MIRFLGSTTVGLGLLSLGSLLNGSELTGGPATPVPSPQARALPPPPALDKEGTCGSHGTQVNFVSTPREAAKVAKKEQKLVFVLHVSGHFEDPRFT